MPVDTINFTTGPSTLPDIGALSYNGCTFSPLFATTVSGNAVKDEAHRTVKYMEYVIAVDGYVTCSPSPSQDITSAMDNLRRLLTAQGGHLVYDGRGCDFNINAAGGGTKDVAWGPIPELLEFQPLGAGRSAKVQWRVTIHVPETKRGDFLGAKSFEQVLQFNYDTSVTYNEDGYSGLSVRGILEIPLTRTPNEVPCYKT